MTLHRFNAVAYSRTLFALHSVSVLPTSNKSRALLRFPFCAVTCFAAVLLGALNRLQTAR